MSRRHAVLHVGEEVLVEDLGSANGTRVRGRALRSGDRARVETGEVVVAIVFKRGCSRARALREPPEDAGSRSNAARARPAAADDVIVVDRASYERGAFTGASPAKPGLLEVANGGTVFLAEVAEMHLATQAKLIRVVEHDLPAEAFTGQEFHRLAMRATCSSTRRDDFVDQDRRDRGRKIVGDAARGPFRAADHAKDVRT